MSITISTPKEREGYWFEYNNKHAEGERRLLV